MKDTTKVIREALERMENEVSYYQTALDEAEALVSEIESLETLEDVFYFQNREYSSDFNTLDQFIEHCEGVITAEEIVAGMIENAHMNVCPSLFDDNAMLTKWDCINRIQSIESMIDKMKHKYL